MIWGRAQKIGLVLFGICSAFISHGQYYSVVDLGPAEASSSEAYAADNGEQGGHASFWGSSIRSAVTWNGTASGLTNLTPNYTLSSLIVDMRNGVQVGFSGQFAALWQGTPASAVSLHPTGYLASIARGTNGTFHVGNSTQVGGRFRATLWAGLSNVPIDLGPPESTSSVAYDIHGSQVVGYVLPFDGSLQRATLWNDLGGSYVDLHPAGGYRLSYATGVDENLQGGFAHDEFDAAHAAIWRGSSSSFVDLHPIGAEQSWINAVGSGVQVGYVDWFNINIDHRAYVWRGTNQGQDLSQLLPFDTMQSHAWNVDRVTGDIVGSASTIFRRYGVMFRAHRQGEPLIEQLNPSEVEAIVGDPVITLTGSGFTPESVGFADGQLRPTEFVSGNSIRITLAPEDMTMVRRVVISVRDPANGPSNFLPLNVRPYWVSPDEVSVPVGRSVSGGLPQILQSDDQYLTARFSYDGQRNAPNVTYLVNVQAQSATASELVIQYEVGCTVPGLQQKLEIFNYDNSTWSQVNTSLTSSADVIQQRLVLGNGPKYTGPSRVVRLRYNVYQTLEETPRPTVRMDFLRVRIKP